MQLIAETAWHHEGDFDFMWRLVNELCEHSKTDIIKCHVTLNFDEYMHPDHEIYGMLKSWLFTALQWEKIINLIQSSNKQLMLLVNDTDAVEFAAQYAPPLVELHSICLNNPFILNHLNKHITDKSTIVFGVGGCEISEIDSAIKTLNTDKLLLMFGFQNFPTKYENINLSKIRKLMKLFDHCKFGYADHCAWNEPNNELVTLFCASNGMDYVEKHVTTHYGEERTDYSSAISIEMLNQLADKIKVLEQLEGSGRLGLNEGEKAYSVYGPLKMAAITKRNLNKGDCFELNHIDFKRTGQISDLSQLDVLDHIGKNLICDIQSNQVLMNRHFQSDKGKCK
ncbi:MAG: hypothetical protein HON94_00385 [Methylococcales bacterium]|jgi:N,N'-diacetyllegionaminate synthase|nr:hypothetical protein [Methylococcales bacterium]MBT7408992.1 hypothetical protein [Methylococcales bacterium]